MSTTTFKELSELIQMDKMELMDVYDIIVSKYINETEMVEMMLKGMSSYTLSKVLGTICNIENIAFSEAEIAMLYRNKQLREAYF